MPTSHPLTPDSPAVSLVTLKQWPRFEQWPRLKSVNLPPLHHKEAIGIYNSRADGGIFFYFEIPLIFSLSRDGDHAVNIMSSIGN